MIIISGTRPLRCQRFFQRMTRLSLQIRAGFTLTIAHEQGEVQNAANGGSDGIQLTQVSTSPPYDFWWKGELWHVASADQSAWTLLIIGEANDTDSASSQKQLDYSPVKKGNRIWS